MQFGNLCYSWCLLIRYCLTLWVYDELLNIFISPVRVLYNGFDLPVLLDYRAVDLQLYSVMALLEFLSAKYVIYFLQPRYPQQNRTATWKCNMTDHFSLKLVLQVTFMQYQHAGCHIGLNECFFHILNFSFCVCLKLSSLL